MCLSSSSNNANKNQEPQQGAGCTIRGHVMHKNMRSRAIYFPFISIPDSEWTFKTLLYWEKLSSIVPFDHIENPELLSPFMQRLVKAELVDQIIPAQYLWGIPDFEPAFIRYIEGKLMQSDFHRRYSNSFFQNSFKRSSKIHMEKLGELPQFLLEAGLAKNINYPWFEVENWVAEPFMAYLSTVLGALKEIDSAPITHDLYLSLYYQAFRHESKNNKIAIARDHILENLLPVPEGPVSLHELIRFKQRYGHLLPPVREKIEAYSTEIAAIQNDEERIARAETITIELKEDISGITEAMKISWKKVVFEILTPLAGAGGAVYATSHSQNAIAAAAAGFSFVAACYRAISSSNPDRTLESKPLAYLAFANREFRNA